MSIKTLSSREFNQDTSGAKKAANHGPVIITDRGKPAHVLLSMQDYQRLLGQPAKLSELLAMRSVVDAEFDPAKIVVRARPVDLT
jgi:prevent-host-death family protein